HVALQLSTVVPQTSDEFDDRKLGLQWQWQANPESTWKFMTNEGTLRLYAQPLDEGVKNYWTVPNILLQKFPADQFQVTTKLTFNPINDGDKVGFIVMGRSYAYLSLTNKNGELQLGYTLCEEADQGHPEKIQKIQTIADSTIYLRVKADQGAIRHFSYSTDGK